MAEEKKTFIEIPSEDRNIKKVSSEILASLSPYKVDEHRLFDIKLCVEEAVRNAIIHGNNADKKLHVKVNYWINDDKLSIEVEDEGPGFDPDLIPDPTKDSNIMKESGRGVRLIRKLMDKIDFNEKGNKIRMEKVLK